MRRVGFGDPLGDERLRGHARRAWDLCARGDDAGARALVARIDADLWLRVERSGADAVPVASLSPLASPAWPLARWLLEQAPAELGACFSLGRAALPLAEALAEVESEHGVALGRATLRAGFTRGHLLELTIGVPGGSGAEREGEAAESLARAVLGERLFETWIGAVHAKSEPRLGSLRVLDVRAPQTTLQVSELFDTVAAAVRGVQLGLPAVPYSERCIDDGAEWTMLDVEPLPDAGSEHKEDLLLASTCMPELLRCYLDGAPCSSRRFSRWGETFAYVSYSDDERDTRARLARRGEVEAALASALSGVGAVTGVGLGLRSTYVDVALSRLEPALERLVPALCRLGLPRDTFVRFVDSELSERGLAIWQQTRFGADGG